MINADKALHELPIVMVPDDQIMMLGTKFDPANPPGFIPNPNNPSQLLIDPANPGSPETVNVFLGAVAISLHNSFGLANRDQTATAGNIMIVDAAGDGDAVDSGYYLSASKTASPTDLDSEAIVPRGVVKDIISDAVNPLHIDLTQAQSDISTLQQQSITIDDSQTSNTTVWSSTKTNSEIVAAIANTTSIDDTQTSTTNTWSSDKTNTQILSATNGKANKVPGATAGRITTLTAGGEFADSGKAFGYDSTGFTIPTSAQVDAAITAGLLNMPSLPSVAAATTANDSLTGLTARDGVTPISGDYILVKNQTITGNNGIYKTALGAWVRQKLVGSAYADVTTETTFAGLGINHGIVNVLGGTANKNTQFQITCVSESLPFATTTVYVTTVTAKPVANASHLFADSSIGNDSNNGSQSFPVASLARAFALMTTTPAAITLMGNTGYSSAITWTQTNTSVQGANMLENGGQQTITGVQTFASGSRYNHFKNLNFNTGSAAPFSYTSGALCSAILSNITINSSAADWLGLNAGTRNWIRLNNISFTVNGLNAINLPSFTNAFTVYVENQDTFCGPLFFSGTGAANTTVFVGAGVAEGNVRVPGTFVGSLYTSAPFTQRLGSFQHPSGVITSQADLTAVLSHTASTGYDGFYVISGFNPTSFSRGAIIGKQTVAGVGTSTWYARQFAYAPGVLHDIAGNLYTASATSDWAIFTANSSAIPSYTISNRPANNNTIGYCSTIGVLEELNSSIGILPLSNLVINGVRTDATNPSGSNVTGLWVNNSGATIGTTFTQGSLAYWNAATSTWTDCYSFGNLPSTVTAGGSVYQKYKAGWVTFGVSTLGSMRYTRTTSQASPNGAVVICDVVDSPRVGNDMSYNMATGDILLTTPGQYVLDAGIGEGASNSDQAQISTQFYNVTTGTFIGTNSIDRSMTSGSWNSVTSSSAKARITITAPTIIRHIITSNNVVSSISNSVQRAWLDVKLEAATTPIIPSVDNRVGIVANSQNTVALDNIQARWSATSPNANMVVEIATVSASALVSWSTKALLNGVSYNPSGEQTLTTTWVNVSTGDTSRSAGDRVEVLVTDKSAGRFYRVTGMVTSAYSPVPICIERLV